MNVIMDNTLIVCLFALTTSSLPTGPTSRHGFPPNILHVSMKDADPSQRHPTVLTKDAVLDTFSENFDYLRSIYRGRRDLRDESTSIKHDYMIPDEVNNLSTKVNALNDSHAQLMVHWLGDKVMICLARDQPLSSLEESNKNLPSPSSVYFSYDYGDTFVDKTHLFRVVQNGQEKPSTIDQFATHSKFNVVIFTDSHNKALFLLRGQKDDVIRSMVSFTPSDISFYENDPKILLVHDKDDSNHKLYLTTDSGASFTVLQTYVKSFSWSIGEDDETSYLYVERIEPGNSTSVIFIRACDLLARTETWDFEVLIDNLQDFHIKKDFMFAVVNGSNTMQLMISYKRGVFTKADFQTELAIKAFHIANIEGNRILVAAAHEDVLCHLYVSEWNSIMSQMKFVPSLENIFSYIPKITWTSGWIGQTTDEAFTDLYKVEGLQGIYIASKISHDTRLRPEIAITPEHLQSVITFDHGASWQPIVPPTHDDEGQFISCTNSCSLHLFQKFNQLYPFTRAVTILSSKQAPGVIMSSGVIGKSLKGQPAVFLSRDAGLTWKQILKNYYFFNFGDHGGILVAVKYFKSKGETREILYSTDEGETWKSHSFHTVDLKLYSLMTEPNTNTAIFTLFGSEPSKHLWLIIKIDLKSAFSYNCTHDDYKMWSPRSQNGESLMPCIMGAQQTFQRRMPKSNCLSSKGYVRLIKTEVCPCDSYDFECDFGFSRSSRTSACIRNQTSIKMYDPYEIPKTCKPGEYYNRTRGYKKIEGNACIDGNENRYLPQTIPCPVAMSTNFLIIAQRDRISKIDLNSGENETLPINGLKNVISIDYDVKHNCVFWADIMSDVIGRQCLDGNHVVEILVETELASVEGMSYDWVSELLFFVDGTRTKIEAVKTSSDSWARVRTTIIDSQYLVKPRGIVVHPIEGYLFWTEWSSAKPSLSRSNLDGTNIITLFTKPEVDWPNGVTIDYIADRVYWVDASKDYIASCDLNGKRFSKILDRDSTISHPFAVAVFKDLMYWDDWKHNAVFQANKDYGIMVSALTEKLNNLMDLKVYSHSLQHGSNACSKQQNCSHICVGAPRGGFSCLCPEGMVKSIRTNDCLCPGDQVANENKKCPQLANTCAANFFTCDNKLCIPFLYRCDSENDCGDNSDEIDCLYSRPACSPHMFTCKTNNKCIPEYFTCDFDIDCPDKSDEDNCQFNPCQLNEFSCVNKRCISIKWLCDDEDDCRDGSDEVNCTKKNTTADLCKDNEFRCVSTGHCISNQWRCDHDSDCADGSDELDCGYNECAKNEFSCGDGKCIYPTWKCDGDFDCSTGEDEENCTGTHISTSSGNIFPSTVCHDWMFRCGNEKCVPIWWKCDQVNDCGDYSDESGCNKTYTAGVVTSFSTTAMPSFEAKQKCSLNQFECDSGMCLSERYVCDGLPDCVEGEDEQHCSSDLIHSCGPGRFRCRTTNLCLSLSKYCDGIFNCADHSDENNCKKLNNTRNAELRCNSAQFQCDNFCFPLSYICDTKQDCFDGSDEEGCGINGKKRVYQVVGFTVVSRTLNATSFLLSWWVSYKNNMAKRKDQLEYLPSITIAGTNAWQNHSAWLSDHEFRFIRLRPYTSYNVTVYVRVENEYPVPPYLYTVVKTVEGIPSEPLNVTVTKLNGSLVQLTWDPPREVAGELIGYTVYYRPQKTITIPARSVKIGGNVQIATLGPFFKPNITYTFWIRARNSKHESSVSKMVSLALNDAFNIDFLNGLNIKNIGQNNISLQWHQVKGADSYRIQFILMEPYPKISPVKTNKSEITVGNLVAGVQIVFHVSACYKNYIGKSKTITATVKGDPLPEISHIISLNDEKGPLILKWKKPLTSYKNLTYGVYYGTNVNEMFHMARVKTQDLSIQLVDLLQCKSYLISVGIVGPVGPGPLGRNPITVETNSNKKTPTNLTVNMNLQKHLMIVSWEPSCLYGSSYPSYTIYVTNLKSNRISRYSLKWSTNKTLTHCFQNIPPNGVEYKVSVSPDANHHNGTFKIVQAPKLIGPRQLRVWIDKNGTYVVYWKEIDPDLLNFKYNYELVIYEGQYTNQLESNIVSKLTANHPPVIVNLDAFGGLEAAGKDFTLGVRIKAENGFMSSIVETEHIIIQEDTSWSSITFTLSPWLANVSIILGLGLLISLIIFATQRHQQRRSRNSFSRFANSHYDTKTGATRIGDTIEEEEEHGHRGILRSADDEPLVIA